MKLLQNALFAAVAAYTGSGLAVGAEHDKKMAVWTTIEPLADCYIDQILENDGTTTVHVRISDDQINAVSAACRLKGSVTIPKGYSLKDDLSIDAHYRLNFTNNGDEVYYGLWARFASESMSDYKALRSDITGKSPLEISSDIKVNLPFQGSCDEDVESNLQLKVVRNAFNDVGESGMKVEFQRVEISPLVLEKLDCDNKEVKGEF